MSETENLPTDTEREQIEDDIERLQLALHGEDEIKESEDEDGLQIDERQVTEPVPGPSGVNTSGHFQDHKASDGEVIQQGSSDGVHIICTDDDQEIPISAETCLALNRAYQEILLDSLRRIELALSENRGKQMTLEDGLKESSRKQKSGSSNVQSIKRSLTSFLKPFFKDTNGRFAPENEDYKIKITLHDRKQEVTFPVSWFQKHCDILYSAVVREALQQRIRPMMNKKEIECEKFMKADKENKDEQKQQIKERIEQIDKEIENVKNTPMDQLLSDMDLDSVDWLKISNSDFQGKRDEEDCRKMWKNVLQPGINKEPWIMEETCLLDELVTQHQMKNWCQIAEELGTNRTAFQCLQHYQQNVNEAFTKRHWTQEEDDFLREVVENCRVGDRISWNQVSYFIGGRSSSQCSARWNQIDPTIKHGKWTQEEDCLLLSAFHLYGKDDFSKIATAVPGRNATQCRDRYYNCLDPRLKPPSVWSYEEDKKLIQLVMKHNTKANVRWSRVAEGLEGRTDHMVMTRYRRLMAWQAKCDWIEKQDEPTKKMLGCVTVKRLQKQNSIKKGKKKAGSDNDEQMTMALNLAEFASGVKRNDYQKQLEDRESGDIIVPRPPLSYNYSTRSAQRVWKEKNQLKKMVEEHFSTKFMKDISSNEKLDIPAKTAAEFKPYLNASKTTKINMDKLLEKRHPSRICVSEILALTRKCERQDKKVINRMKRFSKDAKVEKQIQEILKTKEYYDLPIVKRAGRPKKLYLFGPFGKKPTTQYETENVQQLTSVSTNLMLTALEVNGRKLLNNALSKDQDKLSLSEQEDITLLKKLFPPLPTWIKPSPISIHATKLSQRSIHPLQASPASQGKTKLSPLLLDKTQPSTSIAKAQPFPTTLVKTQPSPTSIAKIQPSPTTLVKTQPSPTSIAKTHPSPTTLVKTPSPSLAKTQLSPASFAKTQASPTSLNKTKLSPTSKQPSAAVSSTSQNDPSQVSKRKTKGLPRKSVSKIVPKLTATVEKKERIVKSKSKNKNKEKSETESVCQEPVEDVDKSGVGISAVQGDQPSSSLKKPAVNMETVTPNTLGNLQLKPGQRIIKLPTGTTIPKIGPGVVLQTSSGKISLKPGQRIVKLSGQNVVKLPIQDGVKLPGQDNVKLLDEKIVEPVGPLTKETVTQGNMEQHANTLQKQTASSGGPSPAKIEQINSKPSPHNNPLLPPGIRNMRGFVSLLLQRKLLISKADDDYNVKYYQRQVFHINQATKTSSASDSKQEKADLDLSDTFKAYRGPVSQITKGCSKSGRKTEIWADSVWRDPLENIRKSDDFQLLKRRFQSLFVWPSLLATIQPPDNKIGDQRILNHSSNEDKQDKFHVNIGRPRKYLGKNATLAAVERTNDKFVKMVKDRIEKKKYPRKQYPCSKGKHYYNHLLKSKEWKTSITKKRLMSIKLRKEGVIEPKQPKVRKRPNKYKDADKRQSLRLANKQLSDNLEKAESLHQARSAKTSHPIRVTKNRKKSYSKTFSNLHSAEDAESQVYNDIDDVSGPSLAKKSRMEDGEVMMDVTQIKQEIIDEDLTHENALASTPQCQQSQTGMPGNTISKLVTDQLESMACESSTNLLQNLSNQLSMLQEGGLIPVIMGGQQTPNTATTGYLPVTNVSQGQTTNTPLMPAGSATHLISSPQASHGLPSLAGHVLLAVPLSQLTGGSTNTQTGINIPWQQGVYPVSMVMNANTTIQTQQDSKVFFTSSNTQPAESSAVTQVTSGDGISATSPRHSDEGKTILVNSSLSDSVPLVTTDDGIMTVTPSAVREATSVVTTETGDFEIEFN